MAESASYLKYDEGLVLHNGLPVKWVTGAWGQWEDFDIIIERYNSESDYAGYSVSSLPLSYASANKYGYQISAIDGDIKMYTTRAKSAEFVSKSGRQYNVTSTDPKIPAEYEIDSSETVNVLGCLYPNTAKAGNHYYMGVKFTTDGCPSIPDLTNHGPSSGWSVVHKLKLAQGVGSLSRSFNASNYSAIKNVTIPGTMKSSGNYMGINAYDAVYGKSKLPVRLFENWDAPGFDFYMGLDAGTAKTAYSNMTSGVKQASAINMNVRNLGLSWSAFNVVSGIHASNNVDITGCGSAHDITASYVNIRYPDDVKNISAYNINVSGTGGNAEGLTGTSIKLLDTNAKNVSGVSSYLYRCSAANGISGKTLTLTNNKISGEDLHFSSCSASGAYINLKDSEITNELNIVPCYSAFLYNVSAGSIAWPSAASASEIYTTGASISGLSAKLISVVSGSAYNCSAAMNNDAIGISAKDSYVSGARAAALWLLGNTTAHDCSARFNVTLESAYLDDTLDISAGATYYGFKLYSSTAENTSKKIVYAKDSLLSGTSLPGSAENTSAYNCSAYYITGPYKNCVFSGIPNATGLNNSGDNKTTQFYDIPGPIKVYSQEGNSANLHNVVFADVLNAVSYINSNYPGITATSSFRASGCKLSGTYLLCDKGWGRYYPISELYACKLENPTFILSGYYDNGITFYPGNSAFSTTGRIGFSAVSADHGISDYTLAPSLGCVLSAVQWGQIGGNYWPFTATLSGIYTLSASDYGEMIYVPSGTVIDLSHADFDLRVYSAYRRIWVDNWSNNGGTLILPSAYSGKIIVTGSEGLNYVTVQWA